MPTPKLTDEQMDEALELLRTHGTSARAGAAIGIPRATMQARIDRARARGGPSRDIRSGHIVSGVSTLYDAEGNVRAEWVKTSLDKEQNEAALRTFVEELAEPIKGLAPLIPPPPFSDNKLLSVYPIGDQHHGMYADARETGADYDCKISAQLLTSAVDYLCSNAPDSENALLLDVGDFHHANDSKNETPGHAHRLDVDTRYGNVMYSGAMAMVHCVLRLLQKHRHVTVWIMPGNHNPDAALSHAIAIAFYFHNEPRVTVDLGTAAFKYMRFGKTLIASHHGDGAKPAELPLLMAVDCPQDWAATEHRVWHLGHVHHKAAKDHPGVEVESHRTLAPGNSWDHKKGYRSKREMQRIDYHADLGEVMRTRCNPAMLTMQAQRDLPFA